MCQDPGSSVHSPRELGALDAPSGASPVESEIFYLYMDLYGFYRDAILNSCDYSGC